MMPDMVGNERLDEVVAVVIAGVAAQRQRLAGHLAGGLERFRMQLLLEERSARPWSIRMPAGKGGASCPVISSLASCSAQRTGSLPR